MTMLPDIDAQSWFDYTRDEFGRQIDDRIKDFSLDRAIGEKVAGLQSVLGGASVSMPDQPAPAPAPAPVPQPVAAPPPPPAPEPPQPDYSSAFDDALRSAPNKDAFVQAFNLSEGDTLQRVNSALDYSRNTPAAQPAAAPVQQQQQQQQQQPGGGYVFPVSGYQGEVPLHWGEVSGGADLFAARGTPVVAMRGGKVTGAGANAVGGNYVSIMGDDGNEYYYAHLDGAPAVRSGQTVAAGTHLGGVGDSGNAAGKGTHLHLGVGPTIQSGADKYGGTGGTFDATTLLRQTLAGGQPATPTTAEISGAPRGSGQLGDLQRSMMGQGAQIASWLGEEGQKALQAILVTEGGMGGAVGDNGQSFGPLQFYGGGGQLNNFARQHGMSVKEAGDYVRANPLEAIGWAVGDALNPGYLGRVIQRGLEAGLAGPSLAIFAQQYGQVSKSPERAGQNYTALFGGGNGPILPTGEQVTSALGNVLAAPAQAVSQAGSILGPPARAVSESVGSILGPAARGVADTAGSILGPAAEIAETAGQIGRLITPGGAGPRPDEMRSLLGTAGEVLRTPLPLPGAEEPSPVALGQQLGQYVREHPTEVAGAVLTPWGAAEAMRQIGDTGLGSVLKGPVLKSDQELLEQATPDEIENAARLAQLTFGRNDPLYQPTQEDIASGLRGMQLGYAYGGERSGRPGAPPAMLEEVPTRSVVPGAEPPRTGGYDPALDPDPANQKLTEMLQARPSQVQEAGWVEKRIRELFNRNVTTDRYQDEVLRDMGWTGRAEDTPEQFDLKSRIRQESSDAWSEILVKQRLMPAVAESGEDLEALRRALIHQDNIDKAASIGRRVEREALRTPLRVRGTAAVQEADRTLSQAERDLARLQKAEAEGRAPGAGRVERAEGKVERLQKRLADLTIRRAGQQADVIQRELLRAIAREPLRLDLRDATLRLNAAQRAYSAALDAENPRAIRMAERELDRAEWQHMQAEYGARQAGEVRAERLTERAAGEIEDIAERGPRETPAMARADRDVAYAERDLARARREMQERGSEAAQKKVDAAQARLTRAQARLVEATDEATARRAERAAEKGKQAEEERVFSGGLTVGDSRRGLESIKTMLGGEGSARWARLQRSLDGVYGYVDDLRQDMYQAGLISAETLENWRTNFPHYVPAYILDFLEEGGEQGFRSGSKISFSDPGVRALSVKGTERFREDPIGSLIDLTHQVQRRTRRNLTANAFVDLDLARPEGKRQLVRTDAPREANESIVQRIKDGEVERYIAPPELAAAINSPVSDYAPGFVRNWTTFYRNMITSLNPVFALLRNPTIDVPTYFGRELIRQGGSPTTIPKLVANLAQGYADAFSGITRGEFTGAEAQAFYRGGGGQSTLTARGVEGRQQLLREMTGGGRYGPINSVGDLRRVIGQLGQDVVAPLANVSERVELGPRLAAQRLARERGATTARQTLSGRTVTMDFNEAGTLARTLNSFIPFFNVGMQTPAVMKRAIAENPAAAAATLGYTVAMPTIMAEIWNRSDAERSRNYDDVPEYLKRQGVVVMLPFGETTTDKFGNRIPPHYLLRMGVAAPFSTMTRDGVHQIASAGKLGAEPLEAKDWQMLAADLMWSASPVRADEPGDIPVSLTPEFVPGASTALQLAMNRDFFRNRQIVTERRDRESAALAKGIASAMTTLGRQMDPAFQTNPSAVDFTIRDMLGGWGNILLGGTDALAGIGEPTPQAGSSLLSQPVIGGTLSALGIGSGGGEQLFRAREQTVSGDTLRKLQAAGVEYVPGPTRTEVGNLRLTRDEQTRYQQLTNTYVDENIRRLLQAPSWERMSARAREEAVQRVATAARERATAEMLRSLPIEDVRRRRAELAAGR